MAYLKDILNGIAFRTEDNISNIRIDRITDDSRVVDEGDLFIAVSGYSVDGHKFIKEAISKGAKVILSGKELLLPSGIVKVFIDDMRKAIPVIAGNFYNHPSDVLKLTGITGTNGKTTITYLIENILKGIGKETGVIGTVDYRFKDRKICAKNTTPGALELTALLAEMVKEGTEHVIMEVSSHSLDQHRVGGLSFDIAIFTNITSEHMDYHKTMMNYFNAKAKLFDRLKDDGIAILNSDDRRVARLKRAIRKKVITYGIVNNADVMARNLKVSQEGSSFLAATPNGSVKIATRLIGFHNISNILAGIAASVAQGIDLRKAKDGIESLTLIPGRLEEIDLGQPFKVFVDYAHTEDALYNTLSTLKKIAKRNIITVFGCGGDRDRKKRPLMGRAACRFSDKAIMTSDNPRFEDPYQIIKEIEDGVRGEFSNYVIIEDRRDAIEKAIAIALKDDIVVIAGKGHERCQIIEDKVIPFDDREVVRSILEMKGYAGQRDPKDNAGKVSIGQS
ncbi:MAG: UDP-N-acetylmuramoyl-L-alanyl-D-glutamate--2,6-diaminopimelate ligase [Candidatus Omnitrophica bacterium]|nr:UDP-N-acetylmuramoyl-L-alanyl-D-glutamate--2,6-diaminopimelate ligase [Candidatus Omnitrophota bacterium]